MSEIIPYKKALFIFCSYGGHIDDFENWRKGNEYARGLYTDVNFIENKLGLKNIEILSSQKLTDENFDVNYYTLDNTELAFVRGEAFNFIEYLYHNYCLISIAHRH